MKEKQRKLWEKTRRVGRRAFIFRFGVLKVGLGGTLWTALIFAVSSNFNLIVILNAISLGITLLPAAGFFIARGVWDGTETEYLKFLDQERRDRITLKETDPLSN